MPIIFAQAILLFPTTVRHHGVRSLEMGATFQNLCRAAASGSTSSDARLIFFFSYFWVATLFQPTQIAEDLEEERRLHPGVRPANRRPTFLDYTMTRLTFAGAIFLTFIAILPQCFSAYGLNVPYDRRAVLRRHQPAHYRRRHARYDAPGRDPSAPATLRRLPAQGPDSAAASIKLLLQSREAAQQGNSMWLYVGIAVLVIGGRGDFSLRTLSEDADSCFSARRVPERERRRK